MTIPCIDIGPFLTKQDHKVPMQVKEAAENVGFFSITGVESVVSRELMDKMWAVSQEFFASPTEEKYACKVTRPNGESFPWGYFPTCSEALAHSKGQQTPPDLKEAFSMGPTVNDSNDATAANISWHKLPNVWPNNNNSNKAFQDTMENYFNAMLKLSDILQRIFAISLGLPSEYFLPMSDDPACSLRILHYPPQQERPKEQQLRAGAHTDWGDFTILAQDAVGGLQIYDSKSCKWINVISPPNAFVINIGDLMARWSNDKWRSTLHRVVNASGDDTTPDNSERYSIAFFHIPNMDAKIDVILNDGDEKHYDKTITAGEHLQMMFEKSKKGGTE